jgi:general secretion pathway protein F/type IV pilus assembly protein PilC
MDFSHKIMAGMVAVLAVGISLAVMGGVLSLVHFLLTLPMRRAERARLFLDLIESAIKQGQPVEETLISVSQSRDLSMGPRFHLVAAWLEQNLPLNEALAKVPQFLPPQITSMLRAGRKIGDLRKVVPACRQLLKDAVSQTRGAINYLVILTFVITPMGIAVAEILKVIVLPKYMEISHGIGMGAMTAGVEFTLNHAGTLIALQAGVLLLLWLAALVYMGGPRVVAWFPVLQRVHYWMPWRRKRLQRDFSTMLAVLLDSDVPEPEAVALAADCTANKIFRQRAACAVDDLKRGLKLTQAVQAMDDSGEFGWRLTNAIHGAGGFLKALAGWHESLDAKAFQEEQAAAHGITTALVLWSGVFVGAVVISVFMFLVSLINEGVLW